MAVVFRMSITSATDSLGFACNHIAMIPATHGVAIDVPDMFP